MQRPVKVAAYFCYMVTPHFYLYDFYYLLFFTLLLIFTFYNCLIFTFFINFANKKR